MEKLTKLLRRVRWWQWLLAIDLLFVLLTIAFSFMPDGPIKWQFLWHMTLIGEMSIGAWWSGIGLALVSLLAWELSGSNSGRIGRSWWMIALVLGALMVDEVGSLHERVGDVAGWGGLLPFGLVGVLFLLAALLPLYRERDTRKAAFLITVAFGLYGLVALQEYLEHLLQWPWWLRGFRDGLEEGTELFATFLIFAGLVPLRTWRQRRSLLAMLPVPSRLPYLPAVITGAMILHLASSIVVAGLPDLASRGNPAIVFPLLIYLLMAVSTFWSAQPAGKDDNLSGRWLVVVAGAVLMSAGSMYFSRLAARSGLSYIGLIPFALPPLATGVAALLLGNVRKHLTVLLIGLLAPALIIALEVALGNATVEDLLPGIYLCASVLFILFLMILVEDEVPAPSLLLYLFLFVPALAALVVRSPALWFAGSGVVAYSAGAIFIPALGRLAPGSILDKDVSLQGQ